MSNNLSKAGFTIETHTDQHKPRIAMAIGATMATPKGATLALKLAKLGHVDLLLSFNIKHFLDQALIHKLKNTNNIKVYDKLFFKSPYEKKDYMWHCEVAQRACFFIAYPASANQLAKFNLGFLNDCASLVFHALPNSTLKVISCALNNHIYFSTAVQKNIKNLMKLKEIIFIKPRKGELACSQGEDAMGRALEAEKIFELLKNITSSLPQHCFKIN